MINRPLNELSIEDRWHVVFQIKEKVHEHERRLSDIEAAQKEQGDLMIKCLSAQESFKAIEASIQERVSRLFEILESTRDSVNSGIKELNNILSVHKDDERGKWQSDAKDREQDILYRQQREDTERRHRVTNYWALAAAITASLGLLLALLKALGH